MFEPSFNRDWHRRDAYLAHDRTVIYGCILYLQLRQRDQGGLWIQARVVLTEDTSCNVKSSGPQRITIRLTQPRWVV